ncbi:hypothetical protein [Polyangium fumosum]|uniref:Uncharacterized protein n=1 Tax=Polyangium fumosum TaxID=889272 RepID=A0A4U1IZ26_9BACT|nr:hypothetical protein [Polyangium fumosum]TKC99858.1 hypothetical protein E8A74_36195 [Polyangium fumosum]
MAEEQRVRVDRSLVAVPRARFRRRGNGHMARDVGKGFLYTALAGGVVALLANLDDIRNSKEVKDHWWLMPVALVAIGYMLRKRKHAHAGAVIAVGGAMFALAYLAQQKATAAQAPAGQQAVFRGGDTAAPGGMLPPGPQTGFWLQTSDGRFIRLPNISRRMPINRAQAAM